MGPRGMSHLFVFGLGYSAAAIGTLMVHNEWRVAGTIRSAPGRDSLGTHGLTPLLFSDVPAVESALASATHVLVSVPPSGDGDPVLEAYSGVLRDAPLLRWIGYLSTIGVYGGLDGAWADEETPAEPETSRGLARIGTEKAWEALCFARGVPLDIFRLAGIYGPGRTPFDRIRSGEAQRIVKVGQVFNRIHVDDIAQTVAAAIMRESREAGLRLFNVADDEPAPPQDVILYASSLIGAPAPPEISFESADLSPMARSFYAGNKRIRNAKIKRELGVKLKYPTYREGLRALMAESAS
jgi:nucleoside-diphosphate-sugar epimerase